MKASISTTLDDKYQFFIPIVTWCWNKLGVEVICFCRGNMEITNENKQRYNSGIFDRAKLIGNVIYEQNLKIDMPTFSCPDNKEATYAQCSRLYAAALYFPKEEWLITSDVDMAVFKEPTFLIAGKIFKREQFTVVGHDLVPENQYPICYVCGSANGWKNVMNIENKTYQQCLDELLGKIECENMRGNYWGKDQEQIFNCLSGSDVFVQKQKRAKPMTQFADNRADRDDINWRSYLGPDLIDAHLWRPGYTDENFAKIMELLTFQYPTEDFKWLINYRNKYVELL